MHVKQVVKCCQLSLVVLLSRTIFSPNLYCHPEGGRGKTGRRLLASEGRKEEGREHNLLLPLLLWTLT
jgi:hypothetical protein